MQAPCSRLVRSTALLLVYVLSAAAFSPPAGPLRCGLSRTTMASSQDGKTKLLFIHGKGENGALFRKRLEPLEGAIVAGFATKGAEVECTFLSAPHLIHSDDHFAWWKLKPGERSFQATEWEGMEEAFSVMEKCWKEDGPFDAVLGHSQGAILMTVLLAKAAKEEGYFKPPSAVLFGSAWPRPFEEMVGGLKDVDWAASPYNPKTLHVYDLKDPINPGEHAVRIKELMGPRAEGLEHNNAHGIPMDPASLQVVVSFLTSS
mmetsp:Transcript_57251/g.136060  ORF Transcript_57251/g.136060 Transcript_57251/m.136060 type:complete len:260 (-) Transcript_57251:76-855(-)